MFIKLQAEKGSSTFHIFENVTDVKYNVHPQPVEIHPETKREIEPVNGGYFCNDIPTDESKTRFLNKITGKIDNELFIFLFDGEAYICNNDGKTIQRINEVN